MGFVSLFLATTIIDSDTGLKTVTRTQTTLLNPNSPSQSRSRITRGYTFDLALLCLWNNVGRNAHAYSHRLAARKGTSFLFYFPSLFFLLLPSKRTFTTLYPLILFFFHARNLSLLAFRAEQVTELFFVLSRDSKGAHKQKVQYTGGVALEDIWRLWCGAVHSVCIAPRMYLW